MTNLRSQLFKAFLLGGGGGGGGGGQPLEVCERSNHKVNADNVTKYYVFFFLEKNVFSKKDQNICNIINYNFNNALSKRILNNQVLLENPRTSLTYCTVYDTIPFVSIDLPLINYLVSLVLVDFLQVLL